jgi:hypothetical protein
LLEAYNKIDFLPLYELLLEIRDTWETARTLNALPNSMEEVQIALKSNISHLHQPNATRSLEWLQENGKCIDHMVPRPSTITGAGEGAFAKRDLPEGTVVTGSPVLVIPHYKFLDMYNFEMDDEMDEETKEFIQSPLLTKQVVYNYCLGHKDSTILLFPYGSGVAYLNHNASQANVRIQWAEHGTSGHNETWLEKTPEDMEDVWETNLGIDYITTRPVREGEELFLEYGPEWEEAWKRHIENWEAPEETTTADDWNNNEPIRTQQEQTEKPYPNNIEMRCHVHLAEHDWRENNLDWDRYDLSGEEYQMVYGLPCEILDRDFDDTYTVDLFIDRLTFVPVPDDFEDNHIRTGVPREAIFFLDASYESDLYLENAFRHYIGIPDHMMPEAWKNNGDEGKMSLQKPYEDGDEL